MNAAGSWDRDGRPGAPRSPAPARAPASHLCVSSGAPLGGGTSGRSSHSTGSPSWPSPGSGPEAARAAGRPPISPPRRRCLQRGKRSHVTSAHVTSCSHPNCERHTKLNMSIPHLSISFSKSDRMLTIHVFSCYSLKLFHLSPHRFKQHMVPLY